MLPLPFTHMHTHTYASTEQDLVWEGLSYLSCDARTALCNSLKASLTWAFAFIWMYVQKVPWKLFMALKILMHSFWCYFFQTYSEIFDPKLKHHVKMCWVVDSITGLGMWWLNWIKCSLWNYLSQAAPVVVFTTMRAQIFWQYLLLLLSIWSYSRV